MRKKTLLQNVTGLQNTTEVESSRFREQNPVTNKGVVGEGTRKPPRQSRSFIEQCDNLRPLI